MFIHRKSDIFSRNNLSSGGEIMIDFSKKGKKTTRVVAAVIAILLVVGMVIGLLVTII